MIPKDRSQRLRRSIELIFDRSTITETLESRLKRVNPILRGWGNFYRHAWGAKHVFTGIDNYLWWTIQRWLRKKHPDTQMNRLAAQYGWHKPRQKALRWRDGDYGSRGAGRHPCRALSAGVGPRSSLCVNIEGEPGA